MTPVAALAITSDVVGRQVGPLTHTIDARWLMAYAAGIGETGAHYYDTLHPDGPTAHPIFPVCYEWPLALQLRATILPETIAARGVHAMHDLILHRPPRAGDSLATTARVAAVAQRPAGALVVVRFDTVDNAGRPVTTTEHGSVYRGVAVEGPDREASPRSAAAAVGAGPRAEAQVSVPAYLAHVYTECARIWNPIHTDVAVARRSGLPDIILHGTATLALAVSSLLASLDADPRRVTRVACRFTGMVRLPSTLTVRTSPSVDLDDAGTRVTATGAAASRVTFDVVGADGRPVLSRGALYL